MTSSLVWVDAKDKLPDEEISVLLALDDGEVWTGFLDSGIWRYVSAGKIEGRVMYWAELPAHLEPAKEKADEPLSLTTGSAFDRWCRSLGWQVIKTAMVAMEKDAKPSDKELADIVRNACNDYVSDRVILDM